MERIVINSSGALSTIPVPGLKTLDESRGNPEQARAYNYARIIQIPTHNWSHLVFHSLRISVSFEFENPLERIHFRPFETIY